MVSFAIYPLFGGSFSWEQFRRLVVERGGIGGPACRSRHACAADGEGGFFEPHLDTIFFGSRQLGDSSTAGTARSVVQF